MKRHAGLPLPHVMAVAGIFGFLACEAKGQEVRVLLIRPVDANVIPTDALRTFRRAILEAGPDVAFVRTIAEATDLIELTRYAWSPDEEYGVSETWQFYFQSLDLSQDSLAGRTRPAGFILVGAGKTFAESTQASAKRLREVFHRILRRFRPVVPK